MASDPAALVVRLQADFRQFSNTMKQAGLVTDKAVADIEGKFARANPKLGGIVAMGTTIGNVLGRFASDAISGFIAKLKEANDALVAMDGLAKRAGVSVGDISRLQAVGGAAGVSSDQVNTGLASLAKTLNDARHEETELGKLFALNNVQLKDRQGNILSTNEAFSRMADLVRNAATEYDKIRLAESVGLSANLVPLLEQGGEAIRKQAEASGINNAQIEESVRKAKELKQHWDDIARQVNEGMVPALRTMLRVAQDLGSEGGRILEQWKPWISALETVIRDWLPGIAKQAGAISSLFGPRVTPGDTSLFGEDERPAPPPVTIRGGTKVLPKGGGKAKGGGGDDSDHDSRAEQEKAYIEQLLKTQRILEAEVATLGMSKAQRAAAIELARIGDVTDASRLAKIKETVAQNERLRQVLEQQRQVQEGVQDLARFAGDSMVDAFSSATKGADALKSSIDNIVQALIRAVLQAAILGQGPLAKVLGLAGTNGNVGGVLGGLLGGGGYAPGMAPGAGIGLLAAGGGRVVGPGSGTSDSVPARLSNGEFVTNAAATRRFLPLLEAINSGKLKGFADGGLVGAPQMIQPALAVTRGSSAPPVIDNRRSFTIDARGAQVGVAEQIKATLEAYDRQLERTMPVRLQRAQRRYT